MGIKTCKYCGIEKSLSSFDKVGVSNKDGHTYYRHKCHQCRWPKKKARIDKIHDSILAIKKQSKCLHCGIDDHRVLDFHHRPGTEKLFCIANQRSSGISLDRVIAEIEKCDLLCANCHRIEHWNERTGVEEDGNPPVWGTGDSEFNSRYPDFNKE